MKIACININGLTTHHTAFQQELLINHYDICGVVETKLFADISDAAVKVDGYNLIRCDRPTANYLSRGGGVAIYVRSNITYPIIHSSSDDCTLSDYLLANMIVGGEKLFLLYYTDHLGWHILHSFLTQFQTCYPRADMQSSQEI